jgi:dihydroneopterin aldolase
MAILAMEQFGLMLSGLQPELVPVESLEALHAVVRHGRVPVWLPGSMTKGALDVPASWDVTSDSLAAWLAATLNAERLVLVKACAIPHGLDAERAHEHGIVDAAFAEFVADRGFECYLLPASERARFASMLADPFSAAPADRRLRTARRTRG